MKTALMTLSLLALLLTAGCNENQPNPGPQGGIASNDQQFTIVVPWTVNIKQGEVRTAAVTLTRDTYFKQDVALTFKAEGITVTPAKATIKAGDKPEVLLQIEAAKEAAIGDFRVTVRATPESGAVAQAEFTVRVSAP
ncbi:MAG TPA: hypothetical protein VL860_10700 [Planctomycetota bacterium]|nr:hypothetical protein [Planctomycetota bacterium]